MLSRLSFFVIFLVLCSVLTAQKMGMVEISVSRTNDDDIKTHTTVYQLLKKDSLYRSTSSNYEGFRWEIDSLPVGIYTLKVIADSIDLASFYSIQSDTFQVNVYNFNINQYSHRLSKHPLNDTAKSDIQKMEVSLNTLYGNNTWYETTHKNFNELYSGEFAFNFYTPVARHYTIGAKIGGQYANTGFYNDTSRYLGERTLGKYYSSLIVSGGMINRFTFYNNKLPHKDGLKLDIGITYNFPLFFKHIVRADDNTKIITRYIHRYNDFSAILRLSYKYVGIQAEYRIFNFLKSRYTETPTVRAGIVFLIPVPTE